MSRLQKKCFVLSLAAHGALVVGVVLLAAFRPKPPALSPEEAAPEIDLNATKFLDENLAGGGSPAPLREETSTPQPMSPPIVQPKPEPVRVETPPPAKPPPEPEPVVEDKRDPTGDDVVKEPKPKKPEKIVLTPIKRTEKKPAKDTRAEEREAERVRQAEERARYEAVKLARADAVKRWAQNFNRSMDSLGQNLSSSVTIRIAGGTGTGGTGGGEVYAPWLAFVQKMYEQTFIAPPDCRDSLYALARVSIARDGRVLSDSIVRKSGDDDYDRAVAEALSLVRKVPAFPETAKDNRRDLTIRFVPPKKN